MTDNRGVLTHQQPHMSSACVDDSTRHDTTIESVTMRSNNRLAILIDSFFDLTRQSDRREVEQFSDHNFDAAAFWERKFFGYLLFFSDRSRDLFRF
jgi:hypothetical protein